ncbi:MAG TPA: SGNH/GDSL hydrolase family protein [bacterium]|mgnify:CR=1 FL=1|nr:SGNH/GDSL hydrolase family protein [bacterium]HQL61393.1 SGNH/GDSL hydrolase family protein [bacterium]
MTSKRILLHLVLGCTAIPIGSPDGSAADPPKSFILRDGDRIVFLGDSITEAGTTAEGYITLFRLFCEVNGYEVESLNAGISGHKSNDMLARLQTDVIDKKPDWVSISCGVNDVWHFNHTPPQGIPLEDYQKNMTEIVERCRAAGIEILLLTATPIFENPDGAENIKLAEYNAFLRDLAKEKKLLLCDLFDAFLKQYRQKRTTENVLTTDGVHMNPKGYRLMAREILKTLGATPQEIGRAEKRWELQNNL